MAVLGRRDLLYSNGVPDIPRPGYKYTWIRRIVLTKKYIPGRWEEEVEGEEGG